MNTLTYVVIGLNDEDTLKYCLRSVVENANYSRKYFKTVRFLYIDSGSRDNSIKIANGFNFDVIVLKDKNPNAAKGRKLGFQNCDTEYLCFLDSDMVLLPGTIELIFDYINLGYIGVTGPYYNCNLEDFYSLVDFSQVKKVTPKKSGYYALRLNGFFFVRRDVMIRVGSYDVNLRAEEETDLLIRIKEFYGSSICVLGKPAVLHLNKRTLNLKDRLKSYFFSDKLIYPYVVILKNLRMKSLFFVFQAYESIIFLSISLLLAVLAIYWGKFFYFSILFFLLSKKQGLLHLFFLPLTIPKLIVFKMTDRD